MKTGLVVRARTNLLSTFSLSSFNILYNNFLSYISYFVVFVAAINFGSHDDKVTVGCLCNVQLIDDKPKTNTFSDVILPSSASIFF